MKSFRITDYCHGIVEQYSEGAQLCIDATMGNGTDTLFLCRRLSETGKVIAFDIQKTALVNTEKLLEENGCLEKAELVLDSHENMEKYAEPDSADVIMFNFGYLPGGDHNLATKAESSIAAIEKGISILKKGGLMTLCIYSGGDSGFDEKNGILEYLKELDSKRYLVITHEYFNRPNNPPMPVMIKRMK